MKRLIGMATVSGLTMSLGLLAAPGMATAAPGPPPGPQARTPAPPAPGRPATAPGPAARAAAGQARAGAVRATPAAAAARSNRPGSAARATGQVRASQARAQRSTAAQRTAAVTTAAAPADAPGNADPGQDKVLLCHVTASDTSPFSLIEVAAPAAVNAHLEHGDVAAVNGVCPGPITPPPPGETVTICHRTGVEGTPFALLPVTGTDLAGHLAHGDVAPVGGVCPGAVVLPEVLTPVVPVPRVVPVSVTQSAPARVEQRLVATEVRAASHGGALPVTGAEVGPLVVAGLAMVVAGGTLARSGRRRRTATASTATAV